jgi:F-type H+-transporting ATPase subunit gamma
MSDTTGSLSRQIDSAGDLQSVVRTMKAWAASSIGQYEKSVSALGDYTRTVEQGLGACFRANPPDARAVQRAAPAATSAIGAVVFGSDQGLVGQFNDIIADFAIETLAAFLGEARVLGRWRARACAAGRSGLVAVGALHGAEFSPSYHTAGRPDTARKRSPPRRRRLWAAFPLS